jgi:hypothetical protein
LEGEVIFGWLRKQCRLRRGPVDGRRHLADPAMANLLITHVHHFFVEKLKSAKAILHAALQRKPAEANLAGYGDGYGKAE